MAYFIRLKCCECGDEFLAGFKDRGLTDKEQRKIAKCGGYDYKTKSMVCLKRKVRASNV